MLAQARTNVAAAAASNAASNAASSNANANANATTQFEFVQAPAEDLSFLKDASVDLLVAGTRLPSLPPSLSLRAEPNPRNVTHALTHPAPPLQFVTGGPLSQDAGDRLAAAGVPLFSYYAGCVRSLARPCALGSERLDPMLTFAFFFCGVSGVFGVFVLVCMRALPCARPMIAPRSAPSPSSSQVRTRLPFPLLLLLLPTSPSTYTLCSSPDLRPPPYYYYYCYHYFYYHHHQTLLSKPRA